MRITQAHLESLVKRLNRMKGFGDNPSYSTIGAYDLDYAYGGVSLYKWANDSGACEDVLRTGHIPKRELYNLICAYITGLEEN